MDPAPRSELKIRDMVLREDALSGEINRKTRAKLPDLAHLRPDVRIHIYRHTPGVGECLHGAIRITSAGRWHRVPEFGCRIAQ